MTDWKPLAFETLQQKARLLHNTRAFFMQQSVLEVTTPLLSTSGTTDPTIESLKVSVDGKLNYLQTSPEFFMKRLLAAGSGSIYQIAHAFRDEQQGRHHLAEFTLLEWYVIDWDYVQLMTQIEQLINYLLITPVTFKTYTYENLFETFVGFNPLLVSTNVLLEKLPSNLKYLPRDAALDYFMSIEIMPQLKTSGWFFVTDYPASQASLAKLSDKNPNKAERFELFYNGLELANGFSELQNSEEQMQRFQKDNQQRELNGQTEIQIDEQLIKALKAGLPKCSGVAIGIERLMMVLLDVDSISGVGLN